MVDLGRTIEPKSTQLNADDLIAGPMTITITKVSQSGETDTQPIAINFDGDNGKPWFPCKSMRRVLVQIWSRDGAQYVGKSLQIFRDPTVKFGGFETGGIRISAASHITKPVVMALTETRGKRKPYVVKPLIVEVDPDAAANEAIQNTARLNASQGKSAFDAWWKSISKPERAVAMQIIDELKALTEKADTPADDDVPDYLPDEDEREF